MTQAFDFNLTEKDMDLIRTFKTLLKLDKKTEFSSDDFRAYQLDRFIWDKQHGIGSFFAKLSHNKITEHVGFTRSQISSNNGHTIRTYRWRDPS